MTITYEAPTIERMRAVADNMRPEDVAEVLASTGETPWEALQSSVSLSVMSRVACHDGVPIAVFGIGTFSGDKNFGVPWLLGTPEVAHQARALVRDGRRFVSQWAQQYTALFNFVSADHYPAHKWMLWLGFVPIKVHVLNNHTFIEFSRISQCPQ